jgi:hypothetical protein
MFASMFASKKTLYDDKRESAAKKETIADGAKKPKNAARADEDATSGQPSPGADVGRVSTAVQMWVVSPVQRKMWAG